MWDVRGALAAAAVLVLTAVPPLVVASAVWRHAIDVPIEDQWPFAGEVVAWQRGEYPAWRLWFPNGQHRVVLPKLVMLPLAGWTGWDVRAEMWLDFALTLVTLGLLAALARRTLREVAGARWIWILPLLSAALFSLAGWQSWTWGWMMAAYLNVLGAVLAAWALGRYGARPAGVALATLGAVAASLSFLSGFVLYALVPLAVMLVPFDPATRRRAPSLAAACVVLVTVAGAYAATYPTMLLEGGKGPGLAFDPLGLASFVVHYVGSPLAGRDAPVAAAWGGVGLALFAASVLLVWLRAPDLRRALLPWLLLATYVLGAGALTGVGRLGTGAGLALHSRYTTISALFWASLPACLLLAGRAVRVGDAATWVRGGVALATAVLLVLVVDAYTRVRVEALGRLAGRQRAALEARACLLGDEAPSNACLRVVSHNPRLVRRMIPGLAALRLGPFREAPVPPHAGGPAPSPQGTSTTLPTFRRS